MIKLYSNFLISANTLSTNICSFSKNNLCTWVHQGPVLCPVLCIMLFSTLRFVVNEMRDCSSYARSIDVSMKSSNSYSSHPKIYYYGLIVTTAQYHTTTKSGFKFCVELKFCSRRVRCFRWREALWFGIH